MNETPKKTAPGFDENILNWHSAQLKGSAHTIPRLCPNCLKEGAKDVLIKFTVPRNQYPLGRDSRDSLKFYYCKDCAKVIKANKICDYYADTRTVRLVQLFAVGALTFFAGLAFNLIVLTGIFEIEMKTKPFLENLMFIFPICAMVIALIYMEMTANLKRQMKKYPLLPGMAIWGPAAYCVASTRVGQTTSRYWAVRPEWIKALQSANLSK